MIQVRINGSQKCQIKVYAFGNLELGLPKAIEVGRQIVAGYIGGEFPLVDIKSFRDSLMDNAMQNLADLKASAIRVADSPGKSPSATAKAAPEAAAATEDQEQLDLFGSDVEDGAEVQGDEDAEEEEELEDEEEEDEVDEDEEEEDAKSD